MIVALLGVGGIIPIMLILLWIAMKLHKGHTYSKIFDKYEH